MSRKNQNSSSSLRPVSKNAYNSFIDRISRVMPDDASRTIMVIALDCYLAGDQGFASALNDGMRMVFEMLRFDVDKAIERSARARARRRPQKGDEPAQEVKSESLSEVKAEVKVKKRPALTSPLPYVPDEMYEDSEEMPEEIFVSRRMRRAAAQAMRPKRRWQKIG